MGPAHRGVSNRLVVDCGGRCGYILLAKQNFEQVEGRLRMLLVENPVLQRELLTNLRANKAFMLMLVYQLALAAVLLFAYPSNQRVDLTSDPSAARQLVDFFFLGQYVLASLMAPRSPLGQSAVRRNAKPTRCCLQVHLNRGRL